MRISVSEWSALKLALKLPRALLNPGLLREHAYFSNGRALALTAFVLVALLVFLHVKAQDAKVTRQSDLVAQLAAAKLIDARWDIATARSDAAGPPRVLVQSADLARIQKALDNAIAEARSGALRTTLSELKKAYIEKADVVTRFDKASADSEHALAATMRADAAVTGNVRSAWRDFPQRDRLVAAENLVSHVLAGAQQYHNAPTPAHRASLEAYAADLPRAHSLPRPVQSGLARLEIDVHQLLLLKPLEQMLSERLIALNTAAHLDQVTDVFQRTLSESVAHRERYRIALTIYSLALLVLLTYVGLWGLRRYRALEALCAEQSLELEQARFKAAQDADGSFTPVTRDPPEVEDAVLAADSER